MGNKQRAKAGWAEIIAWIAVLLLWASAASAYIDPRTFGFAAVMGLAFPVFLGLVGLITVVLLFFARQKIWIPLVGLAVCFGAVRRYCPFNFKSTPPKTAIKVISYNTLFLGGPCEDPTTGDNNVALYLELQKADIACLQEVPSFDGYYEQHVFPVMKHAKYHDGILFNGVFIAMFSHYPIVRHELVCQDEGNGSVAFWTVRAPGDTILVINNHLKSIGLSRQDREEFKEMVHAPESKISRQGSKTILSKITHAAAARAGMADKVAAFIDRHRGTPMIVCGDFNDTSISYAYRRVGKDLTDAYVSTGRGFGRSFNRDAIFVRIDQMFCSEEFTPYAAYVDSRMKCSDHYPIVAYFDPTKK